MIALAAGTPDVYLAMAPDGKFVRADCPVNAALWESLPALAAWLAGLTPAQVATLDARKARPVAVTIDWTGCPCHVTEPMPNDACDAHGWSRTLRTIDRRPPRKR